MIKKNTNFFFTEHIKSGSIYSDISITGLSGSFIIIPDINGNILTLTPNSNYLTGNYIINIPVNAVTDFKNTSGISKPFTAKIIGTTLYITPKSLLSHGTKYTITLHTNSITDLANNGLKVFSTKFTTV
jgi:hypothetical protein